MADRRQLTRADIAIGRMALQQRLLTREQLEDCTAALASSGEATSLAEVLVSMGYVTREDADQLTAEAGEQTRVRRGTSRIERPPSGVFRKADLLPRESAPAPAPAPAPVPEFEEETAVDPVVRREKRLRKIVSNIAHDRICPQLLEHIIRNKLTILNAQSLATAMGESRERVVDIFRRWIKAGILQSVGDYPYCYSPIERRQEEIDEFLEAWHDKRMRTLLLGYILSKR